MRALSRCIAAVVATAALTAAASPATAQTSGTYQPYTPAAQTPQQALSAAVLSKRLKTITVRKFGRKTGVKVSFVVPGTYTLTISGAGRDKKVRTFARGSLVVTAAAGTPGPTILLKSRAGYASLKTILQQARQRKITLTATLTYTAPNGQSASTATSYRVKTGF